jgi:cytochrome c5
MVFAALLMLGGAFAAWGVPRAEPAQPAAEIKTPSRDEPGQKPVTLPVPSRGQLLYENHCMVCHESVVHIRTQQQAQSLSALRARVQHWATYMHLRWGKEEVEDVAGHLNSHYYKFESR